MTLTQEDRIKLDKFKTLKLDRIQVETILGKSIINSDWRELNPKDYKKVFKLIANQAAKAAKEKKYLKPPINYGKIFRSIADQDVKHKYGIITPSKTPDNAHLKKVFKRIAIQAAKVANRKQIRTDDDPDKYHFVKSLFKEKTNTDKITFVKISDYYSTKYRTRVSEWKIAGLVNLFNIYNVMKDLVHKMTEHLPPNAKVQISLRTSNSVKQPHTKMLEANKIHNILTEWVNYFIDYYDMTIQDITFKLLAVELPGGAGRVNAIISLDDKRSIIQIKNNDSLCFARAVLVSLSYSIDILQNCFKQKLSLKEIDAINFRRSKDKTTINDGLFSLNEIKYLRQGGEKRLQTILAQAFHRIYSLPITDEGNDFRHVTQIEEKLDVEIQIYNMDTKRMYVGTEKTNKIYLILHDNHYDVISKLPAFVGSNVRNWEANENLKCEACKSPVMCEKENRINCNICSKTFYSKRCLDSHIDNNKCIEDSYVCQLCFKFLKTKVRQPQDHICEERNCANCKSWYTDDHKCFMIRKDIKPSSEKYIFYDFETKLESNGKHVVNYCIAQYMNGTEFIFMNADEFCKWVFTKKHKGYTIIAHYGKGYDFQFVQEWLVAHTQTAKPNVILNGQKILQLEVKKDYNIRFIDSISFTLQPLRDFPKTFGITELAKGYFPHEFNTDANQNYVGIYPDKQFYGYNMMTKKAKQDFNDWYETINSQTFNFREEMYKYCKSDVDILRRGCLKLRELFLLISNVDPFQYITIASVCNAIYRNEFLPKNTIGIVKETPTDNYSIKSIKWLTYLALTHNLNIRHACNGGEQAVIMNGKSYKVDGYCEETKTIYQFHGCYFHGCTRCYEDLKVNETSGMYMHQLFEGTTRINGVILKAGYNLVTIWEHDFDSSKDMKNTILCERDLVEPPKIRDSFFGGRCEPIKLLHNFKVRNEKGRYIDVCSLYPAVMYFDKYPIGHPVKLCTNLHNYDSNWFGFVHCKIIPPRGLYQPVLPYKQKTKHAHKLLFGLCKACMEVINISCTHHSKIKCRNDCKTKDCKDCKENRKILKQTCNYCYNMRNGVCFHTDDERAITGFWCTNEIEKALEKGYKIKEIYEVWHFEHYSCDLWKGYIRKFLKIKLESSKFSCTEEDYRKKAELLGIHLDNLAENPGLRFIAKICLNSLWGKFGQSPKHRQNKYIETEVDFYKIILDNKIESLNLAFLNDSTVYASYETKDEFIKENYNTNIYIACFTTAWARLRLYDMIDRIGTNVCYMDTDSIVYIEDESTKYIFDKYLGDCLGEWTDELNGSYMDFFACAQSKDYGYIKNDGGYVGKVKGFRVTAETEEKMSHQARIDLIKGSINTVHINFTQFTIKNSQIYTQKLVKQWGFQFDKRRIIKISDNDIDTVPYGF